MTTATVRVSIPTRNLLRQLAKGLGKSMREVVEEAIEAYRRPEPDAGSKLGLTASESLAEDPNVLAFQALDEDFLDRNAGRFIAFCHGEAVAVCADRAELFKILAREHPDEPCLIKELTVGKPRVVRFRRPRRITRTNRFGAKRPPAPPG